MFSSKSEAPTHAIRKICAAKLLPCLWNAFKAYAACLDTLCAHIEGWDKEGTCDFTKSKYLQRVRSMNSCTYGLHQLQRGLEGRTCVILTRGKHSWLYFQQYSETGSCNFYKIMHTVKIRRADFGTLVRLQSWPLCPATKSLTVLSVIPMLSWLQPFLRPPHPISWGILFEEFHGMHVFVYLGGLRSAAGSETQTLCLSRRLKNKTVASFSGKKAGHPFHSQVLFRFVDTNWR